MNEGTPRLNIRLLGAPEILVNSDPLPLNHLKARALLFYLAATGGPHTREHLATLLWSETGSREAHHSLRSALYRLRQALRPSQTDKALVSDGEMLSLQPITFDCDVIEFRRLLARGDEDALARAVSLVRGPLLQGFFVGDAPVFEEWVRLEDTRLNQALFEALDRLAALAESGEAWGTAIGYVQQMIQVDPLSELAQQRLMQLYLRQGEVGLALRQYRQFEDLLRQELNLTPSPETQALHDEILRHQRSSRTVAPFQTREPHGLPFIGRDRLLGQLLNLGKEVQAGRGMTVLLQGEGGIGKSRLLDELASRLIAGSPPWIVLQGVCSPFDDLLSHGPFLEALENGVPGYMDDLSIDSDTGSPDAGDRFPRRTLQAVRSLAERAPVLLAIDDLQWANSSTLNLFGLLSMRLHHHPVMLVGTVQHAEAIPALQRLITLGRRRGELHLYNLTPLKVEAVATLLGESGVDSTSVEALAKWLHERSGGNPFLLTEILAQIRAEAILQPVGAGWQLDTSRWLRWRATFTLPERTHDLVSWRLENLSTDAHRMLDVLAVAGQPLPLPILREFPSIPDGSFLSLVEDLEARGLVSERPTATLALPHHLLRETLLHRMSNFYLRTIHKRLAEVMEAYVSPEDDGLLRQIALHAVAGEDIDRARRYGLRVLDNLSQEYTGAETVDFVNQLYDLLAPTASVVESFRLTRALGVLNQSLGRIKTAAHWHRQNLDWAQKAGDIAAQAETCFEMSELALMTNDYQAAIKTAQEGLSKLNDGSRYHQNHLNQPLFGRGHRLLGAAFAMEGSDLATAEDHLRLAAIAHQEAGNPGDLCSALFELGNISAQRGELMRALDYYAESARAAEDGHIYYYLALAHNNFAYHSLLLGQIENAQRSAAQGLKVAEANDLLAALLHLYSTRGEIHLYLAEWNEADGSFQRGLALAEDLGSLERQAGYRGGLALAARGREDLDRANHLLAEAITLIEGQGFWHLRTRLQLWLAETLFERSEFTRAAQLLDTAIDIARAQDRTLLLVQGERLRARLLASEGDWLAANSLFAKTLEIANDLGIPLEIARVQAAWGEATVYHSPDPEEGHSLLEAARPVLSAHQALADLATLAEV